MRRVVALLIAMAIIIPCFLFLPRAQAQEIQFGSYMYGGSYLYDYGISTEVAQDQVISGDTWTSLPDFGLEVEMVSYGASYEEVIVEDSASGAAASATEMASGYVSISSSEVAIGVGSESDSWSGSYGNAEAMSTSQAAAVMTIK